jgi:hypothetical protein
MGTLSANHLRVISSTIRLVEKSLNELQLILSGQLQLTTSKIKKNISEKRRQELLLKLKDLRKEISDFVERFQLNIEITTESQIINSKKSFLEIQLREISPESLNKKYGINTEFNNNYQLLLESLIDRIITL